MPHRAMFCIRLPQISVGFIDPIGTGWGEDVEIDGVHECFSPVWHVRWNGQNLARIYHNLFAVNAEFQRAFQNVSDLLVVMAVFGDEASFLEQDASDHHILSDDKVAAKQRV